MRTEHRNLLAVVILIIVQLLFNNYVNWGTYITIVIFPAIILLLPYRCYSLQTMLMAFLLGLFIDVLGNGVMGLFAGSITLAALMRQALLGLVSDRQSWETKGSPTPRELGVAKFILYCTAFYLIFNLSYCFLENMGFRPFLNTLLRTLISTAVNVPVVLLLASLYQKFKN